MDNLPEDSEEALEIITILAGKLNEMESERVSDIPQSCTTCSQKGDCVDNICLCDEGWTLDDCSMTV